MLRQFLLAVCGVVVSIVYCSAQQIAEAPIPNTWPSISSGCRSAMNTTISCPGFLIGITLKNPRLKLDQLTALCTTQCLSDLESARAVIAQACPAPANYLELDDTTFPATWMVDNYLYTYKLSCQKDPVSNQFCDILRASWLAMGSTTQEQECSDCVLGGLVTALNSPFGYDKQFEEDFRSRTSSCNKATYTYNIPGTYTLAPHSTTTSAAIPTPSCRARHIVSGADDCASIARQYSISTWSLISLNGLDFQCRRLQSNLSLCIDVECPTHNVVSGETCDSIVADANGAFTGNQLAVWNPHLDALCKNLMDIPANVICVGPPGGTIPPAQGTTALAPSIPSVPAPIPTNNAPNSTANCGTWYTVKVGDTCSMISVKFGIALDDLYFLNPYLNAECTNLWLDTAYCVRAVGAISTYPGYPTTPAGNVTAPYTLTSETYTTETWSTYSYDISVLPASTAAPLAPGTWSNCSNYKEGVKRPDFVEQLDNPNDRSYYHGPSESYCNSTAAVWDVSMADFLTWNPSLVEGNAAGNCTLSPDFRYCTLFGNSRLPHRLDSLCDAVRRSDVKAGTNPSCNCFRAVVGFDKGYYDCDNLVDEHNVTEAEILAWNTWAGSDCNNGIYTELSTTDTDSYNAVCVGLGGNSTSSRTIISASRTTSKASTLTTTSAGPTMSGMVSGCTQMYTVKAGDGCPSITTQFSITFAQLYTWNPAIGSNCESLWLGYAYCVAVGTSTISGSTMSSNGVPPPMQTQEGIPPGCAMYHTAVSGDTCYDIAVEFGISLSQFYAWNPPVGTDCSGVWLGYSYCVAGGPQA